MKPIITGVLGYGFSGRIFHCPFIEAHEDFSLKTIVSRHSDEPLNDYPFIQLARSYEDMLNDTDIELVVVTTPNHLHYEHAKLALNHNKHVLVEKPYTATYEEAVELNQLAEEKGLTISVYQNRRYDGDFLTIKKLKDQGKLDKIHEVNMTWDLYEEVGALSWKEAGYVGADLVYDLGPHLLDQALYLFGLPLNFHTIAKKVRKDSKIVDWFQLSLDYGDFVARIKSSLTATYKEPRYRILTDKAGYVFHKMGEQEPQLLSGLKPLDAEYGDSAMYDIYDKNGNITHKQVEKGNYLMYYTQLARAIRQGEKPPVTKEESARLIKYLSNVK